MSGEQKKRSDYSYAREIAHRLVDVGVVPFKDGRVQYVRLHGAREGEKIEFGPPLRSHRMFSMKRRSLIERRAREFSAFAAAADQTDWRVWAIHYPTRKTQLDAVVEDLKRFNALINNIFSRLRDSCEFQCLILGIHIEFDHTTQLFDIHAHFVCKVSAVDREKVRRLLMQAFSRTNLGDEPLRSAQAFARYIEKTFKLANVVKWPIEALVGIWPLVDHKFHYVRTGGDFANWGRDKPPTTRTAEQEQKAGKKKNRKDTRYTGNAWDYQDQPLVRKRWKIDGELVDGTLYRSAATASPKAPAPWASSTSYPSALCTTTQSSIPNEHGGGMIPANASVPVDAGIDCQPANFALAEIRHRITGLVYGRSRIGRLQLTPDRRELMSRNYITKAQSHGAAHQVNRNGKKPTPGNVREILGSGSFTTIAGHLESWVPLDQLDELPPVPDGLKRSVDDLTVDIWHMARTSARDEHDAELAQSLKDTAEAQVAAAKAGVHADRLAEEVGAAREFISALEKTVADRDRQIDDYVKHVRQLEIDAAKKSAEIETLRRLISQFTPSGVEDSKSSKPPKAKVPNEAHPSA
jgi:hypothetical protein